MLNVPTLQQNLPLQLSVGSPDAQECPVNFGFPAGLAEFQTSVSFPSAAVSTHHFDDHWV
jgi:hypothetical protein